MRTIPILKLLHDLKGEATRRPAPPNFAEAKRALLLLRSTYRTRPGHFIEGAHRLRQLEWMVNRVWTLETANPGIALHFGSGAVKDEVLEATALTESAYYLAYRFKGVIEAIGRSLEGETACKNFNPLGIRIVRNVLLEHASLGMSTFATGGGLPHGPRLRPFQKYAADAVNDPGLYANVDEFLADFVRRATAGCAWHRQSQNTVTKG